MTPTPPDPQPRPETAGSLPSSAFDAYLEELFAREDPLLRELRGEMIERGFPVIQVPAVSARALQLLVLALRPRRVLEVGTLAGYSAIWMGRALPSEGSLVTVERDPQRAELARRFIDRAGLADAVRVEVGDAGEILAGLGPEGGFDLVFLDADKERNAEYADHAARLLRSGGVLVVDNALWRGSVLEEDDGADAATAAVAAFNRRMAEDSRFVSTVLTVGDGLLVGVRS